MTATSISTPTVSRVTDRAAKRGLDRVRMLYQHFAHEPIGVWEILREDSRGLYVRGRLITNIERGRDVGALLEEGAINALTRQMAVDYGLFGIRSNCIIVGFTPTGGEIMDKMVKTEAFISATLERMFGGQLTRISTAYPLACPLAVPQADRQR